MDRAQLLAARAEVAASPGGAEVAASQGGAEVAASPGGAEVAASPAGAEVAASPAGAEVKAFPEGAWVAAACHETQALEQYMLTMGGRSWNGQQQRDAVGAPLKKFL